MEKNETGDQSSVKDPIKIDLQKLLDEGDIFTNGASACAITGIANSIIAANQIFITLLFIFFPPPNKLTLRTTVLLP